MCCTLPSPHGQIKRTYILIGTGLIRGSYYYLINGWALSFQWLMNNSAPVPKSWLSVFIEKKKKRKHRYVRGTQWEEICLTWGQKLEVLVRRVRTQVQKHVEELFQCYDRFPRLTIPNVGITSIIFWSRVESILKAQSLRTLPDHKAKHDYWSCGSCDLNTISKFHFHVCFYSFCWSKKVWRPKPTVCWWIPVQHYCLNLFCFRKLWL